MVRMIMHGCNGAMGQVITGLVSQMEDIAIVAGIDMADNKQNEYPVFTSLEDCDVAADVIVDFASVKAVDHLLDYCAAKKLPVVVCTTGLSEEQTAKVAETAKEVAVLRSANMSLGVNLLLKLVAEAAKTLAAAGFDMEIVEKHHNQKVDAPSGTALMIADAINAEAGNSYEYVYDRSQVRQKRGAKELGISSVRGGGIVGEHDVLFCGPEEVLTLSHSAGSRGVFADGAVQAALYVAGREPGYYTMTDLLRGKLPCV